MKKIKEEFDKLDPVTLGLLGILIGTFLGIGLAVFMYFYPEPFRGWLIK